MNKLFSFFKELCKLYDNFGFLFMLKLKVIFRLKKDESYKHKIIISFLEKKYAGFIEQYKKRIPDRTRIESDAPIWYCWFQGKSCMPLVVESCFCSVKKNAGKHPVIFIDLENINNYISLPDFIWRKFRYGDIGLAAFSDIVRFNLLAKYGGLWLDSTIFLTQEIALNDLPFFSIKKAVGDNIFISQEKWCVFCIGGCINNLLFRFIVDFYNEYFKTHSQVIDYFLTDYIIKIAYNNLSYVKK